MISNLVSNNNISKSVTNNNITNNVTNNKITNIVTEKISGGGNDGSFKIPKEEYNEIVRDNLNKILNSFVSIIKNEIPNYYLYKDINCRVKTIESVNRKIVFKNYGSWKDCSDYCGVAIIVHPFKTIDDVMEILNNLNLKNENCKDFKVVKSENIGPKDSSSFGYRATHVDVLFNGFKIEIQCRTIFQDVMNVISHTDYEIARLNGYNNAHSLPREIHQISSLMEISENMSIAMVKKHQTPMPVELIESPNDLKLLFIKKFNFNKINNSIWEFDHLFQVCKKNNLLNVSDLEIKLNLFLTKLNPDHNQIKKNSKLIFKFIQFIQFGDSFDPKSESDPNLIFESFNQIKGLLPL